MRKQHNGFVSFDFLFSLIPILLIVFYTLHFSSFLEHRAEEQISRQISFDKLVSASNYVVKVAAAKKEGENFPNAKVSPNLIPDSDFSGLAHSLGERLRINLSIGFEEEGFGPKGTCIYRLVVHEPTREIRKLYFCGD
jgi:hypothetical protein